MKNSILYIMLYMIIISNGYSKTWKVPSEVSTLSEAIVKAGDMDTILVADGIYKGIANRGLTWSDKHLVIRSENGADKCTIDCEYSDRAFVLQNGQDTRDVIYGFTITRGWFKSPDTEIGGGAILVSGTSPRISNCIFRQNIAGDTIASARFSFWKDGGAIDCINAAPVIENNIFENNFANHTGGALHYNASGGILRNNIIRNNKNRGCYGGGGIALLGISTPYIVNNLIINNSTEYYGYGGYGGGIICLNSAPKIINNTICNNTTVLDGNLGEGGGIRVRGLPAPVIQNCIIRDNNSKPGLENIDFQYPSEYIDINHCNIKGGLSGIKLVYSSPANIDADPLFNDWEIGDYSLSTSSPCMNKGALDTTNLHIPQKDLKGDERVQGGIIDMGAYEIFTITSGIDDEKDVLKEIRIFPNPVKSIIYLKVNDTENLQQLTITDSQGKLIKSKFLTNNPIDWVHVEDLIPGVYLLEISGDNYRKQLKFIKE